MMQQVAVSVNCWWSKIKGASLASHSIYLLHHYIEENIKKIFISLKRVLMSQTDKFKNRSYEDHMIY